MISDGKPLFLSYRRHGLDNVDDLSHTDFTVGVYVGRLDNCLCQFLT
jgi:hypothetical protein